MFTCYISKEELADYLGKTIDELPENSMTLMQRASELIAIASRKAFKPHNERHVEAIKLATCAQCQQWIENDINPVADNVVSTYRLGELSVTYDKGNSSPNKLCTMAIQYLNSCHLLYKGMG